MIRSASDEASPGRTRTAVEGAPAAGYAVAAVVLLRRLVRGRRRHATLDVL